MLQKSLRLSVIFFLFMFVALQAQTQFSFSDFQYPDESVIYGSRNKVSYFIPADALTLLDSNAVILKFKTSEVLNKKESFVTIAVGGIPVATKSPSEDNALDFYIPLKPWQESSGFFKIEVMSNLKIGQDICEIYNNGAFWIRRLPSSHILLHTDPNKEVTQVPEYISDFIPIANKMVLPENPSTNVIAYAAYIDFYFKDKFRNPLQIIKWGDTLTQDLDRAIVLGEYDVESDFHTDLVKKALPENQGVLILQTKQKDTLTMVAKPYNRNLLVTGGTTQGFEKAAKTLLNADMLSAAFTDRIVVEKGMNLSRVNPEHEFGKVTFRQLGAEDELIEGIGKLTREITLPSAVFGADLKEMELQLNFNYRPIKTTESAYVNIYLDGVLKKSHALDGTGHYDEAILFEHFEIKKSNSLQVEFYYVPEGGLCVIDPPAFYAQTNMDKSGFRALSYHEDPALNFFYFPENFQKKPIQIYLGKGDQQQQIAAVASLIGRINSKTRKDVPFIYPKILPLDSLDFSADNAFNTIILTNDLKGYERILNEYAYLDVIDNRFNYRNDKYKDFFDIDYDNQIGFNQLFLHKGNAVMFIYNPADDAATMANLIGQIDGGYMSNTGNLILASPKKSFFMDLKNPEETMTQEALEAGFDIYWSKYGIFLVFALFIVMIVTLTYIFQKSQQSKNAITNAN